MFQLKDGKEACKIYKFTCSIFVLEINDTYESFLIDEWYSHSNE